MHEIVLHVKHWDMKWMYISWQELCLKIVSQNSYEKTDIYTKNIQKMNFFGFDEKDEISQNSTDVIFP